MYGDILFAIFLFPQLDVKLSGMRDMRLGRGEFESDTVDSTAKPTRSLFGQLGRNKRKKEKRDHAIPYEQQLHAVHVVRGASGLVLLAGPMFSGNIPAGEALYAQKFSARQRTTVFYLSADTANSPIGATMWHVFPNSRWRALDPHLRAMAS